ncbi:MAG TPA: tetratricopeptide repeat protein [Myxococcales bacterium]|nr:tetratricopeptide repeat protein [Myxococcales bacterium]
MRQLVSILLLICWLPLAAWADERDDKSKSPVLPTVIQGIGPGERYNALKKIQDVSKRFGQMSQDFDLEMKYTVLREAGKRRKFLERSYSKLVDEIDVVQRQRRIEAIAVFKKFIETYPNHPKRTPDTMFRLAELYYEQAQVDHGVYETQYEKDLSLYDRGKIPSQPTLVSINFSESIKLFDEIIRRFPKYRYASESYYLKGIAQIRSGLHKEARDSFLKLARLYPKSKFVAEAWMRVGEYHFDFGEYQQAAKAYAESIKHKKSKFFDMVLYKLAWTYFNMYDYDRAIAGFKRLIGYYQDQEGNIDKVGLGVGSALRKEAIEYLARSLAEDDWNGDGEKDANAGVQRALSYLNEGKKFEIEILEEYAKALFGLYEKDKFKEAAEVYTHLIARDSTNPRNPDFHEQLIESYDRAQDMAGAASARDDLISLYNKKSKWYRANIGNAKATTKADRMVEGALQQRAKYHHLNAQNLKVQAKAEGNSAKLRESRVAYKKAISAYRDYLEAYPNNRDSYEIKYLMAEALYYSDQFKKAAEQYAVVRDIPNHKEYQETAGFNAIKSIEKHMNALATKGFLAKKALANDAEDPPDTVKAGKGTKIVRAKAKKIPKIALRWVEHSDRYSELKLKHTADEEFPMQQKYKVALVYYNYRHFDEARKRFEDIIKKWPLKREAAYSAFNIINSYKQENDWVNIEKWTDRVTKEGIGRPEDVAALKKEIKTFRLGVQFDNAMALQEDKSYVEAAKEFERIVNENPRTKVADKALVNAAVNYQKAKHWNSAARVFERIVTEPQFRGSKFREDALNQLAENNLRFFEFNKSIQFFQNLVRSFPNSKKIPNAVLQTAQLQERVGRLQEAAKTYQRYSSKFQSEDNAPWALFKAGLVYEKLKDEGSQIKIWKAFISRYRKQPGVDSKIVEATLRMADIYNAAGSRKGAIKFYGKTIEEFVKRGLQPETKAAGFAAKAEFALIESRFKRYKGLKLKGSLANQGRIIKQARKLMGELQAAYGTLPKYRAYDWMIAALYRIARLNELYAKLFYGAPDPPGVSDRGMEEYRTMIEDEGLRWENAAIQNYEIAIKQARRLKIVNKWTMKLRTTLNRFKPAAYPLFKEEKRRYDYGTGFNVPLTTQPEKKAPEPEVKTESKPKTEPAVTPTPAGNKKQPTPPSPKAETQPTETPTNSIPVPVDDIPVPGESI